MRAKSRLAEMAASSFPSCQARPKSSSWIESKRPSAAASFPIARFASPISDRRAIAAPQSREQLAQFSLRRRRFRGDRKLVEEIQHGSQSGWLRRRSHRQPGRDPFPDDALV